MATRTTKPKSDLAYLCRALKAPSLGAAIERLAERARTDGWTHEEFLAACLEPSPLVGVVPTVRRTRPVCVDVVTRARGTSDDAR